MSAAPSVPFRGRDWGAYASVPPPPTAPAPRPKAPATVALTPRTASAAERLEAALRPSGYDFDAEMDATELDERDHPGPTWTVRGRRLSRSNLTIRTRRSCSLGRRVLLAVHLIDSHPVPLSGIAQSCEYDGEGMYLIDLELMPVPDRPEVRQWLQQIGK